MKRWRPGNRNLVDYRKVKKVECNGENFASKLELALFKYLERTGHREIQRQVNLRLTAAKILYVADFSAIDPVGVFRYHEAKGFESAVWRIKRRLFEHYGDAPLHVYAMGYKDVRLVETIIPKGVPDGR